MQIRNVQVSVGTTQIPVSAQVKEGQRQVILFTNVSTGGEVITLSLGEEAQALAGIPLTAFGSSWSETIDSAFSPSALQWYAVCSGAGGKLSIHERLL